MHDSSFQKNISQNFGKNINTSNIIDITEGGVKVKGKVSAKSFEYAPISDKDCIGFSFRKLIFGISKEGRINPKKQ